MVRAGLFPDPAVRARLMAARTGDLVALAMPYADEEFLEGLPFEARVDAFTTPAPRPSIPEYILERRQSLWCYAAMDLYARIGGFLRVVSELRRLLDELGSPRDVRAGVLRAPTGSPPCWLPTTPGTAALPATPVWRTVPKELNT